MASNFSRYWISDRWLVTIDYAKDVTAGSSVHPGLAAAAPGPARWWGVISYRSRLRSLAPPRFLEFGELLGGGASIAATFGGAAGANPGGPPWPPSSITHAMTGWIETKALVPAPKATRPSAWPVVGGCRP